MSEVRRVVCFACVVPDTPGVGARVLRALRDQGVLLQAARAYHLHGEEALIQVVPERAEEFAAAAERAGVGPWSREIGFYVSAEDRPGTLAEILERLARAKINVNSLEAVTAGGAVGALLFVSSKDVDAAERALKA